MTLKKASAGNSGPKVRSDCEINIEIRKSGGIKIDLKSKVKALYGESIILLLKEIFNLAGIKQADVIVSDSGALPFVISARAEAVIRKIVDPAFEFLPAMHRDNLYSTVRERYRFTRLYLPGNTPGMMLNAGLHSPDGIILDLEDSVAPDKKSEARILVRNALRQINFCGAERMVRINQGRDGIEDLSFVIPHNVNLILLPKCEDPEEVRAVEKEIEAIKKKHKQSNPVWLMPIIESAAGVENAFGIAKSSSSVVAMAIGLEDLTADLGVQRTTEGRESLYARMRIVNAARASGIQAIDSVFSDVADMEALMNTVKVSKSLGFEGMGCIHPRQIAVIKDGFKPSKEEIEKGRKIVIAFEEAHKMGLGVVALGSKMIDPPVVARAQRTIDLALNLGLLDPGWREESGEDKNNN